MLNPRSPQSSRLNGPADVYKRAVAVAELGGECGLIGRSARQCLAHPGLGGKAPGLALVMTVAFLALLLLGVGEAVSVFGDEQPRGFINERACIRFAHVG